MKIIVEPMGAVRQNRSDAWRKRPCVLRYRVYKNIIRLQCKELDCALQLLFELPMPKSWSKKKKKEMLGQPHQQKPDIDNLVKGLLDAVCTDDSYIYKVDAEKRWAETGAICVETLI